MRIVTLIGLIGSGKSSFRSLMQEKAHPCLDLDSACMDLYALEPVKKALCERFGVGIYKDFAAGVINKAVVAQRIFSSKHDLYALEEILYPRLESVLHGWLADQEAKKHSLCLIECSVYKGSKTAFKVPDEWLVAVSALPHIRVERLIRRGLGHKDIEARMRNQLPDAELEALAHQVINNNGTHEDLRCRFNVWYEQYCS